MKLPWLALALTFATLGVAACGDDKGDETGAAGTPEKIVIQTSLTIPTGEVAAGSSMGGSPFCSGGKFGDGDGSSDTGSVDRTVRCSDGTLRIGFSPGDLHGHTQVGPWKIISGTGAYKGLRGSGRMEVTFDSGSSTKGHETFTGTVSAP